MPTQLQKRKTNFPDLYSWSSLCYHYGIRNLSLHHQNFLRRNTEIFAGWFLLISEQKQRYDHRDGRARKSKWKPCYLDIRHQARVIIERHWNRTFDFTEIVNEREYRRGTVCHIVRFISKLSKDLHIQILKYFPS